MTELQERRPYLGVTLNPRTEQFRSIVDQELRGLPENQRTNADVVMAIIDVESSGNFWAVRYEPGYRWLYHHREFASRLRITAETEEVMQKTSFGLMQVMGAVARERGFQAELHRLADPRLGIMYGLLHLAWLRQRWHISEDSDLISAYNQGSPEKTPGGHYLNQAYVNKVHQRLLSLRSL